MGDSFWSPYLRCLPTVEDYMKFSPQYLSAELLSTFRDVPVVADIRDWLDHVESEYQLLRYLSIDAVSFEDYKWARVTWLNRAYGMNMRSLYDGPTGALVPVADLANTAVDLT